MSSARPNGLTRSLFAQLLPSALVLLSACGPLPGTGSDAGRSDGGAAGDGGSGAARLQLSASTKTVLDSTTSLTWQREVSAEWNWTEAGRLCATLNLDGTGWRMPTRVELNTIVDSTRNSPAIDPVAFPNTRSVAFWTSTLVDGSTTSAWSVDFGFGVNNAHVTTYPSAVRCVR